MSVPNVLYRVLNGRLGVRNPSGVELHAFLGTCSSGTVEVPTRHSRQEDLLNIYTSGPAPELAIRAIEVFGAEAVMCRATASVANTFDTIIVTGVTGTSVVTKDAACACDDDYEAKVKIVTGGTLGVAGITLQHSLDNGRTWSAITALGTAVVFTIPNSGGVKFAMAAGTLIAGDTWSLVTHAAKWSTGNLSTALTALKNSLHAWQALWIAGAMSATEAATVQTFLNGLETTTGRARKAYVQLRMPTTSAGVPETEAAYLTSVSTDYLAFGDRRITPSYAACRVQSSRTGRPLVFRRSPLYAISGLPQSLPLAIDMAQVVDATPGGLPGVSLYDSNGNNVEHDEMLNPGADDARFLALRSWPDKTGVYVNNPRTLEAVGGDFFLDQHVRILNVFCNEARLVLLDELSRDLDVNLKTKGPNVAGAPTEAECQRIDKRVREAVLAKLKGQVSGIEWALHRDDLLLTTQTLNGDGGIIFKGYPKLINFTVAAINPAAR